MRFLAIIPVVFTAAALALSFVCLFAGSSPGSLESYDLLTINTSRIGINVFSQAQNTQSAPSNSGDNTGLLGLLTNITNTFQNATGSFESSLENMINAALNNTLQSFARELGLPDFFSFHVLDHCEGVYSPSGSSNRKVTQCSPTDGLKPFNITQALEDGLRNETGISLTLAQINWPDSITQEFDDLRTAFKAIFVFYCLVVAFTGCALLASAAGIFLHSPIATYANNGFTWLAAIFSIVVSSLVTASLGEAVTNTNTNGRQVNITAKRGNGFLGLTWAATVLLWIAGFIWAYECFTSVRNRKKIPKQLQ